MSTSLGRFDVVTIFPDYLAPLQLSLVGKARQRGIVDIAVHDLRDWTTDRHRTVDDTPYGGGAGMVMRPDVWGQALDALMQREATQRVLLVPTPAGAPWTQQRSQELADRVAAGAQVVVACGRYEGIDARVTEHYRGREDIVVEEFSLGDYVLNGGEVAALVLIEAVVRLLPGVVGNPESVVEESHGLDGLLEYPAYTQPPVWRDLAVPAVLTSGDHGRIQAWRRQQSVLRTAKVRPDLLPHPTIRVAHRSDATALSDLATATFPMACPPHMQQSDIDDICDQLLSPSAFREYLRDRRRTLLVAELVGVLVGYTMTIAAEPDDHVGPLIPVRPTAEISKCYVRSQFHGAGLADDLIEATIEYARDQGMAGIWLGVNDLNERAQRFYRRQGFHRVGEHPIQFGSFHNLDHVMYRTLT